MMDTEDATQGVSRLSEALSNNKTLKELTIKVGCEDDGVGITMSTLTPGLCRLLRGNRELSKLTLRVQYNVEDEVALQQDGSEVISLVAQAASGHESLQQLTLDFWMELSENAAVAIGTMLRESPRLRELTMREISVEPASLRQLALGLQGMNSALEKLTLCRRYSASFFLNRFILVTCCSEPSLL
jgi:hypothetical protein